MHTTGANRFCSATGLAVVVLLQIGLTNPAWASDSAPPGGDVATAAAYDLDFARSTLKYSAVTVFLDISLGAVSYAALFHPATSFVVSHPTSISMAGFRLSGGICAKAVSEGLARASGLEPAMGLRGLAGLFLGLSIGAMSPALVFLTAMSIFCYMNETHYPGGPWEEARGLVITTGILMGSAMVLNTLSIALFTKEARRHIAALEQGAGPVASRKSRATLAVQPWFNRESAGMALAGQW